MVAQVALSPAAFCSSKVTLSAPSASVIASRKLGGRIERVVLHKLADADGIVLAAGLVAAAAAGGQRQHHDHGAEQSSEFLMFIFFLLNALPATKKAAQSSVQPCQNRIGKSQMVLVFLQHKRLLLSLK